MDQYQILLKATFGFFLCKSLAEKFLQSFFGVTTKILEVSIPGLTDTQKISGKKYDPWGHFGWLLIESLKILGNVIHDN